MNPQQQRANPSQALQEFLGPAILRGWKTRDGNAINFILVGVWLWLTREGRGFPCDVEFRAVDLCAYFCRPNHASALQWIDNLEELGLVERIDGRRGRKGSIRVRVLDPYEVADRLGLSRPDPQIEFGFVAEPDLLGFPTSPSEPNDDLNCQSSAQDSDIIEAAVGAADASSPLREALVQTLGASRYELWLGVHRFQASEPPTLYLPVLYEATLPLPLRREIVAAAAAAGFPSLEIAFDPHLKCQSSAQPAAQDSDILPPSKPASYLLRSSTGASKQASERASDFWSVEKAGDIPPFVRRAEALYDRIGDASMTRGMAVFASVLVELGEVTADEVERLASEHPYDFNLAFPKFCGQRWRRPIGRFKTLVKRALGVTWKDRWDLPRKARPKS